MQRHLSDIQSESSIYNSFSGDIPVNNVHQRKRSMKLATTLILSTALEKNPTHWDQTLLYKQDQVIESFIDPRSEYTPRIHFWRWMLCEGIYHVVISSVTMIWHAVCVCVCVS